jgi:hypothetical protein
MFIVQATYDAFAMNGTGLMNVINIYWSLEISIMTGHCSLHHQLLHTKRYLQNKRINNSIHKPFFNISANIMEVLINNTFYIN